MPTQAPRPWTINALMAHLWTCGFTSRQSAGEQDGDDGALNVWDDEGRRGEGRGSYTMVGLKAGEVQEPIYEISSQLRTALGLGDRGAAR